jgi:hypothetical protein
VVSPIPGHAFFEQADFQGLLGNNLFQVMGLAAENLDLPRRCLTRGVPGQAFLARLEELLRPAVIKALGDTLTAPARAIETGSS